MEDEYKKSCIEMNNEEHSYKMSIPMFEEGELERFDSNIHSIVEEYSKMLFKEKDQILTQRIIMKQEEEIDRLNNKVEELDTKWINSLQQEEEYEEGWRELKEIIDEAREYIENKIDIAEQRFVSIPNKVVDIEVLNKLLEILDKGE